MNLLFATVYFIFFDLTAYLSSGLVNDFMRSTGKIWVVVASLLIIFVAITVFLFIVEKKISKIEKELKDE